MALIFTTDMQPSLGGPWFRGSLRSHLNQRRSGPGVPAPVGELGGEGVQVRTPHVLSSSRDDVVPLGGGGTEDRHQALGPGEEPDVEVSAAVTPAADVHAADVGEVLD